MKKLKLSTPTTSHPIDPVDIFNRLTLRGSIENIWDTQADALRQWHREHRADSDVVIQMNTGGGKTLVGLLMAQSLVNETRGRVLYVCANNQLIEQTQQRAAEIGLTPTTRYAGQWHNQSEFVAGETFCLTNYHTVFNGHSVFTRDTPIDALVLDDAHVAESIIRGCFSVRLPHTGDASRQILTLLRRHFAKSPHASQFEDVASGRFAPVLYVPMYVLWQHASEIRTILIKQPIDDDPKNKYSWEHLKNHLNRCCLLVDGQQIELAPPTLPLHTLQYFASGVRRVYLTATLPSRSSFIRTFGLASPIVIEPSGKSGEAQRLFVFTPGESDDEQRQEALSFVRDHKSCVICPSKQKASAWVPPAVLFEGDTSEAQLDAFRKSSSNEMLALVARYDGIDLPGKSCRVLVLDRLPRGESLLETFLDQGIQIETIRISHTATRVVQAIGRIFRSNTDHGVVILVGAELQSWLRTPRWRAYLPKLLQQQVLLSMELAKHVETGTETWVSLMTAVLDGDRNWDETYSEHIDQFEAHSSSGEVDWYVNLLPIERDAYRLLWDGQYGQAADRYGELMHQAQKHEPRLGAWYRHWRAQCMLCSGDRGRSFAEFVAAANTRAELGRPGAAFGDAFAPPPTSVITDQATRIRTLYEKRKAYIYSTLDRIERDLEYGPDTSKAEQSLSDLGELLGVEPSRPDRKSRGAGPDVLWNGGQGAPPRGFELKTDKQPGSVYKKDDDIGQCHNHEAWMKEHFGDGSNMAIVGRYLPVSSKANPSDTLRVILIETLRDLLSRTREMFDSVAAGDPASLTFEIQRWLNFYGLDWPACVDALESRLAADLRADE